MTTARSKALKAAARQRLAEGQGALDLGIDTIGTDGAPLELLATKSGHLWDALCTAYQVLGFDAAVSIENWRPRAEHWRGGRATPPTYSPHC
jgi:hypothetical protein